MKYVFRNNTIERFFGKDFSFSGYDDISMIPADAESYVWWYQVPIKYEQNVLAEEVNGYLQKLGFVLSRIDSNKTLVALTMDILYNVPFTDNDYQLAAAVADYNSALYQAESQYSNVKVIDIREFSRQYPANELIDWKFYFISQMGMNPKLSKSFKAWFERKMESVALKRKGDMEKCAEILGKSYSCSVLIKGGHLEDDEMCDTLYDAEEQQCFHYQAPKIESQNLHGTGCTLSSAIATKLSQGHSLKEAIALAKDYVTKAIDAAKDLKIGHGHGPLWHF